MSGLSETSGGETDGWDVNQSIHTHGQAHKGTLG